jgi:hypothetical protein
VSTNSRGASAARRIARAAAIPALLLGIGVVSATTTNAANAAAGGTTLTGGQILTGGQYIVNGNGEMVMGTDGNLVVTACGHAVWATGTVNHPGAYVKMQTDGNLVVYSPSGSALWSSGTANHPGAYLTIQTDTNAVVYGPQGAALWNSKTFGATDCSDKLFDVNEGGGVLTTTSPLWSADHSHEMFISESTLFIYSAPANRYTYTSCNGAAYTAHVQNGAFVVYNYYGVPACSTGTSTNGGSYLEMQNDGNAVLYTDWRTVLWSSQTAGQ